MKKKGIIYVLICISIIVISLFLTMYLINRKMKKFDYNSSKKIAVSILKNNKKQLSKIGNDVYEIKSSIENPIKKISYVSYSKTNYINTEYVQFDIDGQGMLGGQYYGIIYSMKDINNGKKRKVYYDEYKNNIFVYEKIEDNWYFYYFDYDGKINIKEK